MQAGKWKLISFAYPSTYQSEFAVECCVWGAYILEMFNTLKVMLNQLCGLNSTFGHWKMQMDIRERYQTRQYKIDFLVF